MWIKRLLNLILCLSLLIYSTGDVLSQTAQTQGTPSGLENYLKVRIVDFSGGQNSKFYADKIKDNQGALVSNGVVNVPGQLTTRLGQSLFNQDTQSPAFNGVTRFDIENGTAVTSYLVVASGSQVVTSFNNSNTWTVQNQGYPIPSANPINFVQANNLLFTLTGTGNTMWYGGGTGTVSQPTVIQSGVNTGFTVASGSAINWNGGGVYNPNGTSTVNNVLMTFPPNGTTGTWLNNYLFIAGNTVFPDYIFYSQNLNPTSFPVVNAQEIQSGDGQPIQRIEPYRTGDIVVYKGSPVSQKGSTYDFNISGNGNTTCVPQPGCQFSYTPLTLDVGTLSPRTVVSLGNDQWFLSSVPFGVRSVIRSQFDKLSVNLISQSIQDYFDGTGTVTINPIQVSKACAVYYDNKYILAFATGNSTVNNTVAVYDFIAQSWYVINGWYPGQWVVFQGNLYYIDANDGRLIQCFTGVQGDFGTVVPATQASGPTVGIDLNFVSKIYDFDNPENYKQLNAFIIEYQPTSSGTATISVNLDNTGWQTAGTINLQPSTDSLPINLPFYLIQSGITYQTLQVSQFGRFKKIQFKVEVNGAGQYIQLQKVTAVARLFTYNLE